MPCHIRMKKLNALINYILFEAFVISLQYSYQEVHAALYLACSGGSDLFLVVADGKDATRIQSRIGCSNKVHI